MACFGFATLYCNKAIDLKQIFFVDVSSLSVPLEAMGEKSRH